MPYYRRTRWYWRRSWRARPRPNGGQGCLWMFGILMALLALSVIVHAIAAVVPTQQTPVQDRVIVATAEPMNSSYLQQLHTPDTSDELTPGGQLFNPPSLFCEVNSCVSTFWTDARGYVVQCRNGRYSHSGGIRGACSRDGGVANSP